MYVFSKSQRFAGAMIKIVHAVSMEYVKSMKSGFEYFRGELTGVPNIFESQVLLATSGGENRLQNIKNASYCHYLHPDTNDFTLFDKRTDLIIDKGRTFATEIINDEWLKQIFNNTFRNTENSITGIEQIKVEK